MGWASCGTDELGRPIGYAHEGTCDHEACAREIDRGLAHACGGMHGEEGAYGGEACSGYFCELHIYAHGCKVKPGGKS